jgi:hypothetical protein
MEDIRLQLRRSKLPGNKWTDPDADNERRARLPDDSAVM